MVTSMIMVTLKTMMTTITVSMRNMIKIYDNDTNYKNDNNRKGYDNNDEDDKKLIIIIIISTDRNLNFPGAFMLSF